VILVDTGAFLARHMRGDQHHAEASRVWQDVARSGEPSLTTSFVIDEALTLIGRRAGNGMAAAVGPALYASRVLEIPDPSRDEQLAALGTLERLADQQLTFADCLSFGLLRARHIERVFGLDGDFRVAGFILVPGGSTSA
jgi:predicted nucleic acid-binding protein